MIVNGVYRIPGRGTVITVNADASPDAAGVKVGSVLRNRSGACWRVTGIECASKFGFGLDPIRGFIVNGIGVPLAGSELVCGDMPSVVGELPEVPV